MSQDSLDVQLTRDQLACFPTDQIPQLGYYSYDVYIDDRNHKLEVVGR